MCSGARNSNGTPRASPTSRPISPPSSRASREGVGIAELPFVRYDPLTGEVYAVLLTSSTVRGPRSAKDRSAKDRSAKDSMPNVVGRCRGMENVREREYLRWNGRHTMSQQ